MKKIFFHILFVFSVFNGFTQIPGVAWSKRFGGNWHDVIDRIVPLGNNGWAVFGTTASTNGDIGTPQGGTDVWVTFWSNSGRLKSKVNLGFLSGDTFTDVVYSNGSLYILCSVLFPPLHDIYLVKMDLNGTILAQQTFGAAADDIPVRLLQYPDGLLILSKTTSTTLPSHHGGTDLYAIKVRDISNTFVVQWDKCYGGSSVDEIFGADMDSNGNAVIVSETASADGDISNHHGGNDIWILNLSPTGTINWQRCYGGGSNEFYGSIVRGSDQNLVVACRSASTNGDVTGLHFGGIGVPDAWVFKIDISGNIIWGNCFGGTGTEMVYGVSEKNNEIFVATTTSTNNNGDVAGYHGGLTDLWTFKLSAAGSLLWQRCLGGSKDETFITSGQSVLARKNAVTTDLDGGCLLLGYSTSLNGDVTGYHGAAASTIKDVWLVKLDNAGVMKWQRCFGGTQAEQNGDIVQLNAINYLLGFSTTSIDGDLSGNYGGQDAWIGRMGPVCYIKGSVYVDINYNSIRDPGEVLYPLPVRLECVKRQDTTIASTSTGLFTIESDTGVYTTKVLPDFPYLTPVPTSYVSSFVTHFTQDSINFGLQPVPGIYDLFVKIIPLNVARPGFPASFLIVYMNIGTAPITNAVLRLQKDNKLNFNTAVPSHNNINQDTIYWNIGTIQPFENIRQILVNCTVKPPPVAQNGDSIKLITSFAISETDITPANNSDTLQMRLQGSFDPNDKLESHAGRLFIPEVLSGEELTYLVRFQNTGTDTAFNIVIKDSLDGNKLNLSSLKMVHASHPYQSQSENGRITWTFNNINLPDSNINKPGSNGFIAFSIKPRTTLQVGDTIKNSASIYFDFNLPVRTNTQNTIVAYAQPAITSFIPTSGGPGATITITGTNFTGATAVGFGGTAASSFNVVNSTTITATVGSGSSGSVSVTTPGGTGSRAGFTFIPAPIISSFTPTSAGTGVTITITGTNFTGATSVSFGGTAASSFIVVNSTTITAIVAAGTSGTVSVITPGGTASLAGFTFIPGPVITSFSPALAGPGNTITITGTNFTGATVVSFGGMAAGSFTVINATTIIAIVGTGASGSVTVTTPGGTFSLAGFTFNLVTAVGDPSGNNSPELTVNPNPGKNIIFITHPASIRGTHLKLIDMGGKTVRTRTVPKNRTQSTISILGLPAGIYKLFWIDEKRTYRRTVMVSF